MPESKNIPQSNSLLDSLNCEVTESETYKKALSHRSIGRNNNEVLEFLGDSVLNLVITEELLKQYPDAREGSLSRLRAYYVRSSTLADIAEDASLGEQLKLGEGELKSGGFRRRSILADAVEAIIGAVYQLQGYERAREYVLGVYKSRLQSPPDLETLKDPKTRLQEWLQGRNEVLPEYQLIEVTGKGHQQSFTIACIITAMDIKTTATAASRRKAEQQAAADALVVIGNG